AIAVGAAEALAELHRLVQHHLERGGGMLGKLVSRDVKDRALHRRQAAELAVEVRRDQLLELGRLARHAAQQLAEEIALLVLLERARLLRRVAAGELPGVQRLQRDLARGGLTPHRSSP